MIGLTLMGHILTGDDVLSKIGTKHASLVCDPQTCLGSFGESYQITTDEIEKAEKYLVDVWAGARSKFKCETFNKLRIHYVIGSTPKPLHSLPPTSSVIHGHIKRAYYVIKKIINLLNDPNIYLDPLSYGWVSEHDMLIPEKCLNPLPLEMSVVVNVQENVEQRIVHAKGVLKMCYILS